MPDSIRQYVEEEGRAPGRDMTEVIINALEIDRELNARLAKYSHRLEEFAKSEGLRMYEDFAEILAKLVVLGLQSASADGSSSARGDDKH